MEFTKLTDTKNNLVPRVSRLTAPGGGKMGDPENEVKQRIGDLMTSFNYNYFDILT